MRKKTNSSSYNSDYDNFGIPKMGMPFIPDLGSFINPKTSKKSDLESGVKRVTNAVSFGFDVDERESTKPQRNRRKANLFERGRRLNNGEAPIDEFEAYQFGNQRDYFGGNNIF